MAKKRNSDVVILAVESTMAKKPNSDVVKLAVEMQGEMPYLGDFSLHQNISTFIVDLCTYWKAENPEHYALQYTEPLSHYVSEKNRANIKNGTVLRLIPSAARTSEDILFKLEKGTPDDKKEAIDKLAKMSSDIAFAQEFIAKNGIQLLVGSVEAEQVDPPFLPNMLMAFLDLMDHGIMPWDEVQPPFIQKVVSFINSQQVMDKRVLSTSLTILENTVQNSQNLFVLVEKEITLPHLLHHISTNKSVEIQQSVLALINALFQKSQDQKRKSWSSILSARQYRTILNNNILISHQNGEIKAEMAHQLYVLQQLLLNQYQERLNTSMEPNDQDATDKIKELRRIAFETDGDVTRRSEYKKEYKKLGFKNDINPAQDFMETPPGILALDNMIFFARNHSDKYTKLVLENCYRADSHECPLGRASIELTKLLTEILKIGEMPLEQGQTFYPMFFAHENPFEELFSICIVLLNKTWKEMNATTEDFSKVISVVRDQIVRTMQNLPSTLDKFSCSINNLTYMEIAEIWNKERINNEEQEMQAPPIKELSRQLEPDIMELIQQHRMKFLEEGTRFKKGKGARERYWYCRLSPNHKVLHYDDWNSDTVPSIDELTHKVSIVDIKSVVTGNDCPHVKDYRRKVRGIWFPFSLILESNTDPTNNSLDFFASDKRTSSYWTDGINSLLHPINSLLRERMTSEYAEQDLDLLLNMEIKLQLLDIEGVTIPQQEPSIPPPPPNYNFCYQLA